MGKGKLYHDSLKKVMIGTCPPEGLSAGAGAKRKSIRSQTVSLIKL